jgi:hypothetical protein
MSAVVRVDGKSLAGGTEVGVVTDSTLVANTGNVGCRSLVAAQRAITEDAVMDLVARVGFGDCLVDGNESVIWMSLLGRLDARPAVIPIGTGQTLVTNTNNTLFYAVRSELIS